MDGIRLLMIVAIAAVAATGAAAGINASVNGDPNGCTLSFDLNGGTGTVPGDITVVDGETVTLPDSDATKDRHLFSGWTDGETTYPQGSDYQVIGDTVLYAVWTPETYTITYELDGGKLPDGTPTEYTYGTAYTLPSAEMEGCVFLGWFTDPGLNEQIETIEKGAYGDVTVYASWGGSQVGTGMSMSISGETVTVNQYGQRTARSVTTGTLSFDYVYYEYGEGYYIERVFDRTVDGVSSVSKDGYWSDEVSDMEWTRAEENVTIDTDYGRKECAVWSTVSSRIGFGYTYQSTETQYVGADDGELYRIVNVSITRYSSIVNKQTVTETMTYDLCDVYTFDAEHYYSVDVYEDRGITVTGQESAVTGSKITLTATASDPYTFAGWYNSQGQLVSSEPTIVTERLFSDLTVLAKNTSDHDDLVSINGDTQYTIVPNVPLTDLRWSVTHEGKETSGTGDSITVSEFGRYSIVYSGTDASGRTVYGLYDLFAGGAYSFTWTYGTDDYNVTLDIDPADYLRCAESDTERSQGSTEHAKQFVTYTDPYIVDLAHQFEKLGEGMSDLDKARIVLSYVQNIPYAYDSSTKGVDEYWKYALETVFDGSGDCEDTSILFCAIVKAMGYDTALMTLYASNSSGGFLNITNHCVSLIAVDGALYDVSYVVDCTTYYFCDTTSTGPDIAKSPWATIKKDTIIVI